MSSSDEDMPIVIHEERIDNVTDFDAACQTFLRKAYASWRKNYS